MTRQDQQGTDGRRASGSQPVQSVERAFQILEGVADGGGVISLSRLAQDTGLPMPTIHRLVRTLVQLGYVRQDRSRQYSLGPRLIRLGEISSSRLGRWARPHMEPVAQEVGESVNLAVLDSDEVLYVGQVMASRNAMRMFTEVGRRVPAHATAVGKAMLAQLPPNDVAELLARRGMPSFTSFTITSPTVLAGVMEEVRRLGYATDDGEQEVGVRCVAVSIGGGSQPMALSISAPSARLSDEKLQRAIVPLRRAAAAITAELGAGTAVG